MFLWSSIYCKFKWSWVVYILLYFHFFCCFFSTYSDLKCTNPFFYSQNSMGTELEPTVIKNVAGWAKVAEGTNILSNTTVNECGIVILTCNLNAIYVRRWFISSNYMDKKRFASARVSLEYLILSEVSIFAHHFHISVYTEHKYHYPYNVLHLSTYTS